MDFLCVCEPRRSLGKEVVLHLHLHVHCAQTEGRVSERAWRAVGRARGALSSGRWSISFSSALSLVSNLMRIWSAAASPPAAATSAVSCALSGRCQAKRARELGLGQG